MLTNQDIITAHPEAADFDQDMLAHWASMADVAVPLDRVKDPRSLHQAQILYVMHQMTKPPIDLNAPHIVARMNNPKPYVKTPSPWTGTRHGDALRTAVKY